MRITTLVYYLLSLPLLAQPQISKVPFTRSTHAIRAFLGSGEGLLPVVKVRLDISKPGRTDEHGNLIIVYDPEFGHFLWIYTTEAYPADTSSFLPALELGSAAVFAGPDALVLFNMPGGLYVCERRQQASSLDAAEIAAIEEIRKRLLGPDRLGAHMDAKEVPALTNDDRGFFCDPLLLSSYCNSMTKIILVKREAAGWRLVLRNRWDHELILDSKFNRVSGRRLPKALDEK